MPDPTIEVSVIILFDGPLMLVNRRPEGSYYAGWWEWPGGKRRPGESALECAQRELAEEIGFEPPTLREYAVESAEYPGRKLRLTFFVGRKPGGAPHAQALEHRWVPPEEVLEMRFLEPNLPVLRRLIEHPPKLPD
jgi:mutator protein MutT